MTTPLVDTHFHLDLTADAAAIVERCEKEGVYTIAVTNSPSVFENTERMTRGRKHLRAALGLHPELAVERRGELPIFEALLSRTRYIGEVGLDYSTNSQEERRVQRSVFGRILDSCSEAGDKLLTIHSRRAADDVVDALQNSFRGKAILHWYSGPMRTLERALALGAYFSINPAMCRSRSFDRLVARLPRDRVLTETDGPFVVIGGRQAEPRDVREVVTALSRMWDLTSPQVAGILYDNFAKALA